MEKAENHQYLEDLVRIRYNNLELAGMTLKNQCLNQIVRHNRHFSRLAKETRLNPLENLPLPLKTDILKKASKRFDSTDRAEDNYAFIRLLVHPQLTRIDLPIFIPNDHALGFPTHFRTVLSLLVEQVPNLREIECYAFTSRRRAPCTDLLFSTLCKLKKLQDISVPEATCNSFHLERLAENLPNLRKLCICMEGDYPRAFKALSRLQHLRYFFFCTPNEYERQDTYYKQCTKYLPRLLRADNSDDECRDHKHLGKWKEPVTLDLEHIEFEHRFRAIPAHCKLPNLKSMALTLGPIFPQPPQIFFKRFDKLTRLSLGIVEQVELFTDVLQAVGHQLLKLDIVECECRSISDIFALCPKLEDFSCSSCNFDTSGPPPKTPLETVANLKKLEMQVYENTFKYPGVVSDLLRAPKLQSVMFFSLHLEQEESECLSRMVRDGVILKNLEYANCYRHNLNLFGCILIDHMMLHCPLKSNLELRECESSDDEFS